MFAGGAGPVGGGSTFKDVFDALKQSSAKGGVKSSDYMKVIGALQGYLPNFTSRVRSGGRSIDLNTIESDIDHFQSLGGTAAQAMQALRKII